MKRFVLLLAMMLSGIAAHAYDPLVAVTAVVQEKCRDAGR